MTEFDVKAAKAEAEAIQTDLRCYSDKALVGEVLLRMEKNQLGAKANQEKLGAMLYELILGVVPHSYWKGGRKPAMED